MTPKKPIELPPCSPKPALKDRRLITSAEAAELMGLFKVLANNTRLRLLHALARCGELCVTDLASSVEMKPQAVSNQLQRLVDRGILKSTRRGNNIHYRVVDPCTLNLLDLGLCLIEEARQRADRPGEPDSASEETQL
jgi:DNA-binding transcriptional ArsR family regulator